MPQLAISLVRCVVSSSACRRCLLHFTGLVRAEEKKLQLARRRQIETLAHKYLRCLGGRSIPALHLRCKPARPKLIPQRDRAPHRNISCSIRGIELGKFLGRTFRRQAER